MPDNILNYFQFNQMKFDELWLVLHFTRKSYFACPYRQNLFYGSKKIYLLKCEFSKTKFVQIGQFLPIGSFPKLPKIGKLWWFLQFLLSVVCVRHRYNGLFDVVSTTWPHLCKLYLISVHPLPTHLIPFSIFCLSTEGYPSVGLAAGGVQYNIIYISS